VRIINEPTASALSFGLARRNQQGRIVVFDFGGGTFDVTILEFDEDVLRVLATSGNNRLGGDDFDQCIIDWVRTTFLKAHGIDPTKDPTALERLREAAEPAKLELSGQSVTDIELPFLAYDAGNPINFRESLTVAEFNEMSSGLVYAASVPVQMALSDAKLKREQIDQVLLVGGTTRIPAVRQFIREFFDQEPVKSVNPDEAVAIGAAIQGGIITGEIQEMLLLDVVPMSMGIGLGNGAVNRIFERNTTIPTSARRTFTTSSDNQASLAMHIVQGEDEVAAKNKSLANISIEGIPAGPATSVQIGVTFNIDADGIFSCEVTETAGGIKPEVKLERTNGLSREGLRKLAAESALEAERERAAEERMSITISAQSCLSDAERTLGKLRERISPGDEESVRTAMAGLREAVANGDAEDIRRTTSALEALVIRYTRELQSGSVPPG